MPDHDLTTADGLAAAIDAVRNDPAYAQWHHGWNAELAEDFDFVQSADEQVRATYEFQNRLWEENHVSAVGMGQVPVQSALKDQIFREWFATRSLVPLPESSPARVDALQHLYGEILERLAPFEKRRPHLKIFRVLALLYPGVLTTLAARRPLNRLSRAMGGPRGKRAIAQHVYVMDRFREAVQDTSTELQGLAELVSLPWQVYAHVVAPGLEDATEAPTEKPGEEKLIPLPVARRRRGITGISGGLPSLMGTLEFIRDGVTREQLLDYLRTEHPKHKESSLGVIIHTLQGEFAVIQLVDDHYVLTERGEALLESGDPAHLSDWLLTHIVGIDLGLVLLRDGGPMPHGDWLREIQSANPGWTTLYAPSAMGTWLRSLGVVETVDGETSLTEEGRSWADLIHWVPERLPKEPVGDLTGDGAEGGEGASPSVQLPAFGAVYEEVAKAGHFDPSRVAQLHAGLWAHSRRHFAILTGLSGSGKTLLARTYARALGPVDATQSARIITIAVQPGWYDPGSLLGYVNPLRGDSYARTPFLEFLLAASEDPEQPYVAILDEMNLSHPEQYLAPLLSAMETGARVVFHSEGDVFDGIPPSIAYPSNLALIGTVNMDETTHGLSDKVLDRAFTMEFWDIDLAAYPLWGQRELPAAVESAARDVLQGLMEALSPARLHFGWRVVDDVLDFLALVGSGDAALPLDDALDRVIYAKVIPKLRGDDSPRFQKALEGVAAALRAHRLKASTAKIEELREDLAATGTARFWR